MHHHFSLLSVRQLSALYVLSKRATCGCFRGSTDMSKKASSMSAAKRRKRPQKTGSWQSQEGLHSDNEVSTPRHEQRARSRKQTQSESGLFVGHWKQAIRWRDLTKCHSEACGPDLHCRRSGWKDDRHCSRPVDHEIEPIVELPLPSMWAHLSLAVIHGTPPPPTHTFTRDHNWETGNEL